ncbi:MAG TPA: hypothetical protein VMU84_17485, partial [Thermoanaerobaculia bacterium]|nr:hypothetical protein [Thermoanaerobaculia bacterium]
EMWNKRSAHAEALFQAGSLDEAHARFTKAEALQKEASQYPLLYSLSGFRFCDFLLSEVECAAWRATLGVDEIPIAPTTLDAVEDRASQTLQWFKTQNYSLLLSIALDNLTLGRVSLYRDILERAAVDDQNSYVEAAVIGIRQAGKTDYLPRALLARAWVCAVHGRAAAANADLDEAQQIAERGPMRLHLADVHLYRARLFFREDREEARGELKKARVLIEQCGYHRRDEELRDAEKVIL